MYAANAHARGTCGVAFREGVACRADGDDANRTTSCLSACTEHYPRIKISLHCATRKYISANFTCRIKKSAENGTRPAAPADEESIRRPGREFSTVVAEERTKFMTPNAERKPKILDGANALVGGVRCKSEIHLSLCVFAVFIMVLISWD